MPRLSANIAATVIVASLLKPPAPRPASTMPSTSSRRQAPSVRPGRCALSRWRTRHRPDDDYDRRPCLPRHGSLRAPGATSPRIRSTACPGAWCVGGAAEAYAQVEPCRLSGHRIGIGDSRCLSRVRRAADSSIRWLSRNPLPILRRIGGQPPGALALADRVPGPHRARCTLPRWQSRLHADARRAASRARSSRRRRCRGAPPVSGCR